MNVEESAAAPVGHDVSGYRAGIQGTVLPHAFRSKAEVSR